jgi:type IV pilus assembly protein PilZ
MRDRVMGQGLQADQRRARRVAIELAVDVTSPDQGDRVPGVSRDLSLGGMFVETAFPAAFGASVLLRFTVPGHAGPLVVPGMVRWTSKGGMGIQFGLLGARETRAITECLRLAASPPAISR